jgi:hypothetical protein
MTDNLEQLEKDWPQKYPKDFHVSQRTATRFNLVVSMILLAVAISNVSWRPIMKSQQTDPLAIVGEVLAILLVPVAFIASYRRIKVKFKEFGNAPELLRTIEYIGSSALLGTSLAVLLLATHLR